MSLGGNLIVANHKITDQRADEAKNGRLIREKEYRLAVYQERKPLYAEACRVASQIATAEKLNEAKKAIQRFNELYYGELCLVEDKAVEGAMVEFQKALQSHLNSNQQPAAELRRAALKLARSAQSGLKLEEVFGIEPGDQGSKLANEESSGKNPSASSLSDKQDKQSR